MSSNRSWPGSTIPARLARIAGAVQRSSRGYRCATEAARLSSLSDPELAALGIKREDIFHHAFQGYTW